MAGLALTGILAGMEKAPDAVFDYIPMFRGHEAEARIKARREAREAKKASGRRTHSADGDRHERRRDSHTRPSRRSHHDDDKHSHSRHREDDKEARYDDRYDDRYNDRRDRHKSSGERARSVDGYGKHRSHRGRREDSGDSDEYEPRPRHHRDAHPPASEHVDRRQSLPVNNGYGYPPAPIGQHARVAASDAQVYNQARRGSGPTPAYVPYADVYASQLPRRAGTDLHVSPAHTPPVSGVGHYTESPPMSPVASRAARNVRGEHDSRRGSLDSYDSDGYSRSRRTSRPYVSSRRD